MQKSWLPTALFMWVWVWLSETGTEKGFNPPHTLDLEIPRDPGQQRAERIAVLGRFARRGGPPGRQRGLVDFFVLGSSQTLVGPFLQLPHSWAGSRNGLRLETCGGSVPFLPSFFLSPSILSFCFRAPPRVPRRAGWALALGVGVGAWRTWKLSLP